MTKSDEEKRSEKLRKLTSDPLYPLLVKMAVPSMVGMIVSTVYSMTDGVSYQSGSKVRLTKNVFAVPKYLKILGDTDNNISCADKSLEECRQLFDDERNKKYSNAKDYGEALKRMHELIGKKLKKQFLPLNLKSSINV